MLVRFKGKNHPQQKTKDHIDDRQLPDGEFWVLHKRFKFTIDVAAAKHNTRLDRYYTKETNGLSKSWEGERVYCNPPYSGIRPWCEKAWASPRAELVVMLLPANRTEQGWWHDYIEPERDREGSGLRVEFLRHRLRFLRPGQTVIGPNERPPFGSCLCIWDFTQVNPK